MSFEQGFKSDSGCVSSPSMIHEAMDHVKTTWSNVLHGKASTTEYLEAAAEVIVVAAGAIALKQGGKMLASRFGASEDIVARQIRQNYETMRETERAFVKEIRAAANANAEYLRTVKRTPEGAIIVDWMPGQLPVNNGPWNTFGLGQPSAYDKVRLAATHRSVIANTPSDSALLKLRSVADDAVKFKDKDKLSIQSGVGKGLSAALNITPPSKLKISG
jgi:hypothetical protein